MLAAFFRGFTYPFRGMRLILHRDLRLFALLPFLINAALFGAGLWWAGSRLYAYVDGWVARLPEWLSWLSWLVVPVLAVASLLILFYGFTVIANLLGSPFNGTLAERVEDLRAADAQRPQRLQRPLWKDLASSSLGELRKLGYFALRAVPLLALLLVPGLNAMFPLLWAAFGAWMLALEYLDYPLGNHGLAFAAQRRVVRRQRALTLGFGSGVLLMTIVPGLNFLAMPSAVIGATLLSMEHRLLPPPSENT